MLVTVIGGHAAAFSVIVDVVFIVFPHFLRWRSAHFRMETPLRGRPGGHTGTAPTIPTHIAVLQR